MADIREIAAMKMKAITGKEPRQKDFWDIYELLNHFSFVEMVNWSIQRNKWDVTEDDIRSGFQKIFDIEESKEGVDCYRGYEWELISIDLKLIVDRYFSQKQDFVIALQEKDLAKMKQMKEQGFVLSFETINFIKTHFPLHTRMFVQSVWGQDDRW